MNHQTQKWLSPASVPGFVDLVSFSLMILGILIYVIKKNLVVLKQEYIVFMTF